LIKPGGYFDLNSSKAEIAALEADMSRPDFWLDQEKARAKSKRRDELVQEVKQWKELKADTETLASMAHSVVDDEVLGKECENLEKRFEELEFFILFSGKRDKSDCILAIHAGAGGTEAQDWAEMLLRMYLRFCERQGLTARIVDESRGGEAGIKSITLEVSGRYAYGWLKSEHGVHRLVRISPFDAESMRHTTFALVDVLPEFEEADEVPLDMNDVRVDTYLASGHGGQGVQTTYSAIRLVHEPTGIMVTCQNERSQQQNKEAALRVLRSKLLQIEIEKKRKELEHIRGDVKSAEWGNQIRSYVLHPYKMVKDHRSGVETQNAEGVLDGDLDAFVEGYLKGQVVSKAKSS